METDLATEKAASFINGVIATVLAIIMSVLIALVWIHFNPIQIECVTNLSTGEKVCHFL